MSIFQKLQSLRLAIEMRSALGKDTSLCKNNGMAESPNVTKGYNSTYKQHITCADGKILRNKCSYNASKKFDCNARRIKATNIDCSSFVGEENHVYRHPWFDRTSGVTGCDFTVRPVGNTLLSLRKGKCHSLFIYHSPVFKTGRIFSRALRDNMDMSWCVP